ncbi:hypothetical protein PIB30_018202 [Stylosanthes scabra]|uniref:Helicase protein MOM1 n=1 Tax=Stylosanthes scabra TaxID=79078 RepID=A0ABU6T883_9FABA|nr:hypothetical protein [Stylosanthes scabra]
MNGKINSSSSVSDTSGVRGSRRTASSKNMIQSPSSAQKSNGLIKRTSSPTPAVKRMSNKVAKQNMPSPSDSESSGSMNSKQKPKKEKSVKQLTFEAKEVNENEEHDLGSSHLEPKRRDARWYRSLFRKPKNGCLTQSKKIDQSSKEIHLNCKEASKNGTLPSQVDSKLTGTVKNLVDPKVGSLVPSNGTNSETNEVPQRVQPDTCGNGTVQLPESRNSLLDEDLVRNDIGHDDSNFLVSDCVGFSCQLAYLIVGNMLDCDPVISSNPSTAEGRLGSAVSSLTVEFEVVGSNSLSTKVGIQDAADTDPSILQKEYPVNSPEEVIKHTCLICKKGGQLLFCGGKGCSGCYHSSCLEPPLVDASIGVWHCHFCVRKKIEFGVYSVSEGVESIWDAKEVSSSNFDGSTTTQKEYLVKYKGVAHVHNRWLPENQLLREAPSLLTNFNMKNQDQRLKLEWTLPHRLLQKRAIISSSQQDDHKIKDGVQDLNCFCEWLVKWRGLGYEHATWELDNGLFLRSPEGQRLIRGYEERFQRAKRDASCSTVNNVSRSCFLNPDWFLWLYLNNHLQKVAQGSSVSKLCQMPGGISSGVGNNNLDAVNKLREHWCKGQNAIVIDDHDSILKVVAFILSLQSYTCQPFLIISNPSSLQSWENEFYQLDPPIDVVTYSGNKEIRDFIRRLEFHNGGGCMLFQVLITSAEIFIEDIDFLRGIEWEAIIVDDCQSAKVSSNVESFKVMNTHLRILLYHGQLKDSIEEYINILSLLNCQTDYEKDALIPDSGNKIDQLKEQLSSHIASKCKSDPVKFIEYWVPVQISHVQLEQYCASLHSNASILRSSAKTDVDALRDIIITARKCCIHPSIVDQTLKSRLVVGLDEADLIDVDIKASGKLQLLDLLLTELKAKNLRGLVLFKSIGGSGRVSSGDFLDDLLRLRFGPNSYERVDKGLLLSKQKDAMRKFNNKDDGRFVFLLDTCACRSGIRLSSVDTIIIFDSDWNPMNDIRSLQKITLDSHPEVVNIFRLYSSFTVEENALILAKQDRILDSNLLNISRTTCQMLLMWGAASLFDDLKIFHHSETSVLSQKSSSGEQHLAQTVHEFSLLLSQDVENDPRNCSILLKVWQNGSTYQTAFPLPGELKHRILEKETPHPFWTDLLEGKQFRWKYSCSSSQRCRKRVDLFDMSGSMATKRRKVSNNVVDHPPSKSEGVKLSNGIKADKVRFNDVESEETTRLREEQRTRLCEEQRSLHLLLKPEIRKLCEVLLLPDNVRDMVDNFLEYVMNNHNVEWVRESVSLLQAFQLSLIWTVAPLLKHKVDHRDSLLFAKQHLNFVCSKEEGVYNYSVLRCLKGLFLHRMGNSKDTGSPISPESSRKVCSSKEVAQEVELFKKDVFRSIREIQKKWQKKLKILKRMQLEERKSLETAFEDEKAEFEKKYKIELLVARTCSPNDVMKTEKLKVLTTEFGKKIEELKREHETRLKALEDTHVAARQDFKYSEDTWVQDVEDWAKNELSNIDASKELGTGFEYTQLFDQENAHKGSEGTAPVSDHLTDKKDHDSTIEAMTNDVQDEVHSSAQSKLDGAVSSMSCENAVQTRGADNGSDNATTETSPLSNEGIGDGAMVGILNRDAPGMPTTDAAPDCLENACPPPSMEQVRDGGLNEILDGCATPETSHNEGRVSVLGREVPVQVETPRMANFSDCPVNAAAVNHFSSVDQTPDKGPINVADSSVSSFRSCQADDPDKVSLPNPRLVQVTDAVSLNVPDGDTPVTMPENSHEVAGSDNDTRPSADKMSVDKSSTVPAQLEGVQQSPSLEAPPAQDTAGEVHNSSERAEVVSDPVGVVPANQSNQVSCILQPSENVVEHQPNRNDDLPHSEAETSAVVPNQDVVQANSIFELGSHSHAVVDSVLNSGHDSLGPVGVRTEVSNSTNLSTPPEINNHPIQTATHSASRMPPPLCADPLKNELERTRKIIEQLTKNHEETRSQLKSDFGKELEALRRKYDIKFQLIQNEFQQKKNNLDSSYRTVLLNRILADAFRSKCMYRKMSDAYGVQQGAGVAQQSVQLARQQSGTFPSHVVDGSSSQGPLSANLHSPSALVSSQNSLPPSNAAYNTPRILSNPPARLPPPLNCNSSPSGSFPVASEMRAPAPHLQPFRPSTPMLAANHPALLHGMPNQPTPMNVPVIAPTLSRGPAQPTLPAYQSVGFSTLSLRATGLRANGNTQSTVCLPKVQPSMSEVVSLNPPRIGSSVDVTPNSPSQAASPELVCLSDDEDE